MPVNFEKRLKARVTMEDSFNIHHNGDPCRVVDISLSGLGVTFLGGKDWPEELTLEYSLDPEFERSGLVKCRTVWESSMDFYKPRKEEIVRRRGLEFMEPGSEDIKELHSFLKNLAEAD